MCKADAPASKACVSVWFTCSCGHAQAAAGKGAGRLARIGAILRVIGADAGEPERVARAGAAVGRLQAQLGELAAQQPRMAAQARSLTPAWASAFPNLLV